MSYIYDSRINLVGISLAGHPTIVLLTQDDKTQSELNAVLAQFDFSCHPMDVEPFNDIAQQELGQPLEVADKFATAALKLKNTTATYSALLDYLLVNQLISQLSYQSTKAAFDGM